MSDRPTLGAVDREGQRARGRAAHRSGLRILLWNIPAYYRDLAFRVLRREPSFEVLPESRSPSLESALAESSVDVVLLHVGAADELDYAELLFTSPRTRLVALDMSSEGRASLFLLRPECVPLGHVGTDELIRVLRDVVTAEGVRGAGGGDAWPKP